MLTVSVPPASYAVSLAEAKAHCVVEHDDDDALIEAMIAAAQQIAEEHCQRRFIAQTLQWTMDSLRLPLMFPLAPVDPASVVVEYVAAGGTDYATFAATNYVVRTRGSDAPSWLELKSTATVPDVEPDHAAPVRITFDCGAATAPKAVQQAIRLIVGDMYRQRETIGPSSLAAVPMSATVETLLAGQLWAWR